MDFSLSPVDLALPGESTKGGDYAKKPSERERENRKAAQAQYDEKTREWNGKTEKHSRKSSLLVAKCSVSQKDFVSRWMPHF